MKQKLHKELQALLDFYRKQRQNPPADFTHVSGVIDNSVGLLVMAHGVVEAAVDPLAPDPDGLGRGRGLCLPGRSAAGAAGSGFARRHPAAAAAKCLVFAHILWGDPLVPCRLVRQERKFYRLRRLTVIAPRM